MQIKPAAARSSISQSVPVLSWGGLVIFLFGAVLLLALNALNLDSILWWIAAALAVMSLIGGLVLLASLVKNTPRSPWIAEFAVDSFWLRDAGFYDDPIRAPLSATSYMTDVLIIGGGFTGMSAAWHLKQQDPTRQITVIDAARCGYGASGRNVGWCMAQNLNLPGTGSKYISAAREMMCEGVSIIEALSNEQGLDCDFTPASIIDLSTAENPTKKFKPVLAACEKFGLPARLLDAAEVQSRFQSSAFTGGAELQDGSASVHPGKLGRGIRDLILQAGVEVFEGTTVSDLDLSSERPKVFTDYGKIEAGEVIIATNAFTKSFGEFQDRYVPIHSSMIATAPLSQAQLDSIGLHRGALFGIAGKGLATSFGNVTADNRIVYGGGQPAIFYNGAFGSGVVREKTDWLATHLTEKIWPQLKGTHIDHKWGGMVAVSRDMVGGLGTHPSHSHVHYALAYTGEGVSTSFACGKTLAERISGLDTELTRNGLVQRKLSWIPGEPLRSLALKFLL